MKLFYGNELVRRPKLVGAMLLMLPAMMFGQSAVVGSLGNFDAANFEGKDVHGLEIQIEGIQPGDLYPSWCGNKYSCPLAVAYATGVYVRYMSPYDSVNHVFTSTTVPHAANTPFGGTCYQGSLSYAAAGCDHFGVHLAFTAAARTAVVMSYRWMVEDPNNAGQLIALPNNIFVPTPVYTYNPPVTVTAAPVLVAEIQVPPPPPPPPAVPPQFGNATWMKVYKTDLGRAVSLDELTGTNPIVPQDATTLETDWVLLQPEPPSGATGGRKRRNRHVNQGGVNAGTRAVLRRYETYAYTGAYNPLTHEVACGGDGLCTAPLTGELGNMLIAQMTAANVAVPSLTVAVTGNGGVSSSDKVISCPGKCVSTYALQTVVNLTAKPGSNSSFTNWSGACAGASLTCAVTIADSMNVSALFTANAPAGGGGAQFTLQVSKSNSGSVASDVAGINCGSACSAKYDAGTTVVLTATPLAGKSFLGWSGVCSGTANTCSVKMTGNLSAQPNFSK